MLEAQDPDEPLHSPLLSTELSTGVYMLFRDGALTYVGRSRNCAARIAGHRDNGRRFDFSLVANCSASDAEWVERAIIQATEAPENRILFAGRRQRTVPEVATVGPSEHPLMLLNKRLAREKARRFMLQREFDLATRSGDLRFRLKNPRATSPTAQQVITLGDLIAWCARVQAEKLNA